MTGTDSKGAAGRHEGTGRDTRHHRRDVFEHALRLTAPVFDSQQDRNPAVSGHFLRVVLREAFPDLHQQDIAILSAAIERVFIERGKS